MSIVTSNNSYVFTGDSPGGTVNISAINLDSSSGSSSTLNLTNNASDGYTGTFFTNNASSLTAFCGISPYFPAFVINQGGPGGGPLFDAYLDGSRLDFHASQNCYFFGNTSGMMNTQFENQGGGSIAFTLVCYPGAQAYTQYVLLSVSNWYAGCDHDTNIYSIGQGTPGAGNYLWIDSSGITHIQTLDVNGASITSPDATNIQVNGITFDGTNILSTYQTGSFTPTILGDATAGTTTYVSQEGFYTIVGNLVTVQLSVVWSAATGTGNMLVGGLPFTINASNLSIGTVFTNIPAPVGSTYVVADPQSSTTTILIFGVNAATGGNTLFPVAGSGSLQITLQYMV